MQDMAESATQTITVEAPASECFAIVTDFEHYPEWAHDVKEAVVKERDHLERATEVEFRASALGRSTHYTLHYDYSDAPGRISWKLVLGAGMRRATAPTCSRRPTASRPRPTSPTSCRSSSWCPCRAS